MTLSPTYLSQNDSELVLIKSGFLDLLLTGVNVDPDGNQFELQAQAEGATWGEPVPIDVAVQRWMSDGAVASTQGHENRDLSFRIVVTAGTSAELSAGEAALARRSGMCLLSWTPSEGVGAAPTTVFEVWTWHLSPDFDTDRENRLSRAYTVTATAKPWVRSKDLVTVPALLAGVTTTSIDTCASTTGWTGSPNAPTTSGGAVRETSTSLTSSLTRTGLITPGVTPYIAIDWTFTSSPSVSLTVSADGTVMVKVAQVGTVGYWKVPTGMTSFTVLKIAASAAFGFGTFQLSVADVSRTDTIPGVGSSKQQSRILEIGGSVPTSGSLQVSSPSATALGTCMVYTRPVLNTDSDHYSPPMRGYRTSGNPVTADSTCVSGSHEALVAAGGSVGTITYTIPISTLPEGTYAVVGRFIFGSAAVMTVTVGTSVTGYSTSQALVGTVTKLLAAGVQWGVVGTITLPPQGTPPESLLNAIITLSATASTGTHSLDEVYLLDMTHGTITLVTAGLNPPFTDFWIDSADVDPDSNRPAVFIGSLSDRTDAATPYFNTLISLGDHDLDPNGSVVFVVTDGVDQAAVSASFYPRWHTNAGA